MISGNAFTKFVKTDPRDRLEIEIGDTHQSDFLPQFKIKRWDNEVNASFRLLDNEPKQLVTEGEKIKLIGPKKEVHFYELPPSEELKEGGYEFEIILKEKPTTNKIEFSIETKGLDFFYQPELTQEDKAMGETQPENAIGSYAVYHKTKGGLNESGGKEYKVGKAGHIFRPKITDANGDWAWEELKIDIEKGILSVTIPQEFLDQAVYPIYSKGVNFGYETKGTTGTGNIKSDGYAYGSVFSPISTGNLDSMSVYIYNTTSTQDNKFCFYDASYNLMDFHNAVDYGICDAYITKTLDDGDLVTSGLDYWLVVSKGSLVTGTAAIYFDVGDAGQASADSLGNYATMPEDPWTPDFDKWAARKYSIYATYTPTPTGIASMRQLIGVGQGTR